MRGRPLRFIFPAFYSPSSEISEERGGGRRKNKNNLERGNVTGFSSGAAWLLAPFNTCNKVDESGRAGRVRGAEGARIEALHPGGVGRPVPAAVLFSPHLAGRKPSSATSRIARTPPIDHPGDEWWCPLSGRRRRASLRRVERKKRTRTANY